MVMPRPDGPAAPRGPWRIRVLGPVEIDHAGRRVEVLGVARAVLALLTRAPGQVVSSIPRGGDRVARGTAVTIGVRAP